MAEAIAQTSTSEQLTEKLNSEEKREQLRKKVSFVFKIACVIIDSFGI